LNYGENRRKEKMFNKSHSKNTKILQNKTLFAIFLTLMLTTTALMAIMPSANAAVIEIDTYAFTMVSPNPVGINQQIIVVAQIDKVSPTAAGEFGGDHFKGITVKITKPDGNIENKGPYEAWSMSNAFFYFTPTTEGKYTFQMSFPGQWINTTAYQYWFKPSTSGIVELTVQKDQITSISDNPLPTDYWTRPVYGENKGWSQVADNWLMRRYNFPSRFFSGDTAYAPYTSAPNSAHVLWTKPIIFGGIAGGPFGDKTYYTGLSYEQFYNPLIINGRIYYIDHGPASYGDRAAGSIDPFGDMGYGTYCLDLYTGEQIWFMNNTLIQFAQLYDIEDPNEHGLIAHLWEATFPDATGMSTWKMYDAFTGRYILTIRNVPMHPLQTNAVVFGPNGELLSYYLDPITDRLVLWNSTMALGQYPMIYYPERYNLVTGANLDGKRGIQWNVSIPDMPIGTVIQELNVQEGYLLASWQSVANWSAYTSYPGIIEEAAFPAELKKDAGTGQYPTSLQPLWLTNRTNIQGRVFYSKNIDGGVYTIFDSPTLLIRGYDVKTGNELWVTETISASGWAYYTYMHHIAYGKLFTLGYDGHLRAFDTKDGKLLWDYYLGSAGYETPYGTWPSYTGFNIADHKIYMTNDDHSPDSVVWRGGKLWVVDADTGQGLWNISGWIRHGAISDGILTALNSLDGQVYTFGKGPSATTVSAPQTAVPKGNSVMLTGTVTDQSPGQKGTPAISDADMGAWMEYLHMQKPIPGNAKGVDILLTAIDPTGNPEDIGTATTDLAGNFGFWWTPKLDGKYTIMATFAGTNSYGSSFATTYIGVGSAPASPSVPPVSTSPIASPSAPASPAVSPTNAPPPDEGGPNTALYVGIAAVIIIAVIAAVAIILRRRK
jgi:hypothetical protein